MKIINQKKYEKYLRKTEEQNLLKIRENIQNMLTTAYPQSDNRITIFVASRTLRIETDLTKEKLDKCMNTFKYKRIDRHEHKTIYNEPKFVEVIKC